MVSEKRPFVHPTAVVEKNSSIAPGCQVWHFSHLRENSILERGVTLGKDVYIDESVVVGEFSRIQNGVSVYKGVKISPWSFIGPHVIFTNDPRPRAGKKSWKPIPTNIGLGASIGAGAIIRCGVELGNFSMVAAGSIVTKDLPPFHLAIGSPAENYKKVCACGETLHDLSNRPKNMVLDCCYKNLDDRLIKLALKLGDDYVHLHHPFS